jgi:cell division septal protein FtsQ
LTVTAIGLAWLLVIGGRYFVRTLFTANDTYIVRNLNIETDGRMTPNLIKQFGGIEEGVNLFANDLAKVREELENVPLIKEVAIRRSLPDTLEVIISERVALAKVAARTDGYEMMVDREGILLGPAGRGQSLPTLSGLRISELKVGRILQGNLALDALNALDMCDRTRLKQFIQIENIDISDAETMEVRLQTGEYVILPRRDLRSKLVDLANILNTCRRQKRQLAKIDMTVENMAPAVEYR